MHWRFVLSRPAPVTKPLTGHLEFRYYQSGTFPEDGSRSTNMNIFAIILIGLLILLGLVYFVAIGFWRAERSTSKPTFVSQSSSSFDGAAELGPLGKTRSSKTTCFWLSIRLSNKSTYTCLGRSTPLSVSEGAGQ